MSKDAWLPGLISGALLGVTTIGHGPVYHVHWFLFVGFVPLWCYWLRNPGTRAILFSGWLCQFTFTLVAFHWIAYTVNEFSHMGFALSTLVLLLYCAVANLQFPLAGFLWTRFFSRGSLSARITALALLTAACERFGTMIFHWNFGYAWLYMGWPGMQLADLVGFRWLCTFTILLNGLALAAWRLKNWKPLLVAVAAFALVNALGAWHLRYLPAPDSVARALLIQPNVGNRDKERLDKDTDAGKFFLRRYFALTDRALASLPTPPSFAVWPENAFPGFIADPDLHFGLGPLMSEYLRSRKLNLLTGGYGMNAAGKATNGLFALSAGGTWLAPAYEKRLLLPFGEYIPLGEKFPILKAWLPDVRDYGAGTGPVILKLGELRLGAQICYEGLFDFIARDLANAGAQILVNITNDSWYGSWQEPWQHFYITMAKAIETRRPLIRDTNTGVSSVILANGAILDQSPMNQEWFHLFEVPYRKDPPATLYMRWGYWIDWIFLAGGLLLAYVFTQRGPRPSAIPGSAE
ncbi:MAG: apolipoprotein N-acyltransferase [Bdellovibrionota bacterium]